MVVVVTAGRCYWGVAASTHRSGVRPETCLAAEAGGHQQPGGLSHNVTAGCHHHHHHHQCCRLCHQTPPQGCHHWCAVRRVARHPGSSSGGRAEQASWQVKQGHQAVVSAEHQQPAVQQQWQQAAAAHHHPEPARGQQHLAALTCLLRCHARCVILLHMLLAAACSQASQWHCRSPVAAAPAAL